MAAQKKQLSLDTNFVFDLAGDKDFAHEFREIFQSKGYALVLPPTAAHELHLIFTHGDSAAERELARTALTHLLQWGIRPFDQDSTAEAICGQFVRGLLQQRLLPDDEFNDGLILAETSLANIPLLVTSDKHLLDMDEDALLLAFNEADLVPVHPVHPKNLLRAMR
ncbi:MAG TPA: PIN domain-containing protein [Candidatus Limnocylindrales bacterium]|nr:PIN domain-containing protein [Candidatus Limnocylindrales bacterium]